MAASWPRVPLTEYSPPPTRPPSPCDGDTAKKSSVVIVECPNPTPTSTASCPRSGHEDDHRKSPPVTSSVDDTVECPPAPTTCPPDDGDGSLLGGRPSFSFLTTLGAGGGGGHQQHVTGIALPQDSDKIFSGSSDGTVRVWDCGSGKCVQVIELGGPIACVIAEGHWVFAGACGAVNVCNTQTRTGLALSGPAGQVYSLATSDDMLFAGVADGSILAWKVTWGGDTDNCVGGACFRPAASLGGHTSAVVSLVVGKGRLYSGSVDRTIRAWDIGTLQCVCTLSAHDDTVTSLLCWSDFLLSCSLDGTIKVWAVVGDGDGELGVVHTRHEGHGVLLLNGVHDTEERPVLMCSLSDNTVRLYDLPGFKDRGRISGRGEVRAMHTGPSGFFFTGDATGELSVWRWPQM